MYFFFSLVFLNDLSFLRADVGNCLINVFIEQTPNSIIWLKMNLCVRKKRSATKQRCHAQLRDFFLSKQKLPLDRKWMWFLWIMGVAWFLVCIYPILQGCWVYVKLNFSSILKWLFSKYQVASEKKHLSKFFYLKLEPKTILICI